MRYAQLIERVVALAGLQQASEAERAVEATLPSLAEVLAADDADALRRGLPAQASRWLQVDTPAAERPSDDVDAFYARVADRSGLELGFAREQAQAVLAAVAEIADQDAVHRVTRHLRPELAALFSLPHEGLGPRSHSPRSAPTPGATSTLAAGRPGSRHPIAEARPDAAHAHSVARSSDPHGDSKLSSARGLTQERLDESLATGRSGPRSTVAESRR